MNSRSEIDKKNEPLGTNLTEKWILRTKLTEKWTSLTAKWVLGAKLKEKWTSEANSIKK